MPDTLGPVIFVEVVALAGAGIAFIFGKSSGLLRLGLRLLGTALVFGVAWLLAMLVVALSGTNYFPAAAWHAVLVFALVTAAVTIVWVTGRWLIRDRRHERHELWTGLSLIAAVVVAGLVGFSWLYSYGGDSPVNVKPPSISGEAQVGETLTADPGRWRPAEGLTLSYHWERCATGCDETPGARAREYVITAADAGARIYVEVVATRVWGESAESAPTRRVSR